MVGWLVSWLVVSNGRKIRAEKKVVTNGWLVLNNGREKGPKKGCEQWLAGWL